ncbi:MAG: hybrid sensor histidine kinase/response regulator [Acidimicrobiales bacterium]
MGEGVCALDESAKVTFFNPAACRMLGWGIDESDRVAMDFLRLPAEDAMASSGGVRAEEAVFRRCDGTEFPVALTASALIQNDRPVGAVIVFRDISERRELEARLQASQKLEALGRLAGGVAHDFNNVLAAISLCGDLLNQAVSGKALDYVSEICASAARATGLTEQLLTFSRSQRLLGGSSDPAEVMTSMQQMLRRLIGAHIDITIEVSAAAGSSVRVDRGRLEQVILNLALNARDAMPGGGTLSIEAGPVDLDSDEVPGLPPGKYVRIRVADTGTGMSSETKEHLFEPFFTTKARGEGTGLGLATVSGIVSGSGGHLSVETGIGVGSTFHVVLPVAPREGAAICDPAPPHSLATSVNEATVLLVEDDTSVREAAAEVLRGAGYRVLQATDGVEGLQVAGQHADQIDLVVTDVLMPRLSGPALVSCLRSAAGRPKVLFMSGYTEDRFSDGLGEGLPLLSKPFNASMLLTTVGAILEDPVPSAGRRPAVDKDRGSD